MAEEDIIFIVHVYDRDGNHFKSTKVITDANNDLTHISNKIHESIFKNNELDENIGIGHFLYNRRKLKFYATLKEEKIPQNASVKFLSPYFRANNGSDVVLVLRP